MKFFSFFFLSAVLMASTLFSGSILDSAQAAELNRVIIIPSIDKQRSSSTSLTVDSNTEVRLWLPTQMGTGYDWISDKQKLENQLIESDGKPMVGFKQTREFRIPYLPGVHQYLFTYKRRWEKSSEDQRSFILKLNQSN